MILRTATLADLDYIMDVEAASFIPQIQEDRNVFEQRIICCSDLFLVFEEESTRKVNGYLSAEFLHRIPHSKDELRLGHLPEKSEKGNHQNQYIYISSFALLPEARGRGAGKIAWQKSLEYFNEKFKVKGFLLLVNQLWKGAMHIYSGSGFTEVDFGDNGDRDKRDRDKCFACRQNPFESFFPNEDGSFSNGILMIKK